MRQALSLSFLCVLVCALVPEDVLGTKLKSVSRRDTKDHHSWNYEDKTGPMHWPEMFKSCGEDRQSPINVNPDDVDVNDELDAFEFENYDVPMQDATIKNNGHTVVVYPNEKEAPRMIDEGGMDDQYKFLQLHFHWGADSKRGSEHTIDGMKFPLEMHLVHRNKNYKTMEKALQKEDGLAVLAVLFKVDDEDNPALQPIIDKLDDVRKEDTVADLDDLSLDDLLPDDLMPYYRYEGSLTTPPCSEVVTWTIFKNFAPISEKQLQQFRMVKEDDPGEQAEPLVDNFRPVQPLGTRIIEISGDNQPGAASTSIPSILLLLMSVIFILLKRW